MKQLSMKKYQREYLPIDFIKDKWLLEEYLLCQFNFQEQKVNNRKKAISENTKRYKIAHKIAHSR